MKRAFVGSTRFAGACATLATLSLCAAAAHADNYVPPGGTIAYALDSMHWAIYLPPHSAKNNAINKAECPDGFNLGPRTEFDQLFPKSGYRTIVGTRLRYESEVWNPTTAPDPFAYHEGGGQIAQGLDLDGKTGPNDLTGPDGQKSIDNQLYRAIGCVESFRPGVNANDYFDDQEIGTDNYNRLLIEITGVTSLENSPHVEVTTYRGLEPLLASAAGKGYLPGGTEQIDTRFGRRYIQHWQGKIVNGVLTTEPSNFDYPWASLGVAVDEFMYAARFQLKLTPTTAEGLIGGYADITSWYQQSNQESTHHQAYGALSSPSVYKALMRLADAYPDPKTGANTAISGALRAKFVQVFVIHPSNAALEAALSPPLKPYAGTPFSPPRSEQALARAPHRGRAFQGD